MSRTEQIVGFATNILLRGLIGTALIFPYATRVRIGGWIVSKIIFPVAGYQKRIRANLEYVCPELTEAQIRALTNAVPDNFGRTLIEEYSGEKFVNRIRDIPVGGAGASALKNARDAGRPAILVTAHFGNYDVVRGNLIANGYKLGALYRPFNNPWFDRHYRRALENIGKPIFARSRRGETDMLRFLKSGGMVGILADQHMQHGAALTFFGKPAATALSAAKMALKYDALLIPVYATRQANGLDFELDIQTPIAHTEPEQMSQEINDSLEAKVRANMGQWNWGHKRWKLNRTTRLVRQPPSGDAQPPESGPDPRPE